MRATELFRALRDESIADHVKVETAHQAWISPEFTFPKQREFLTEWLLGRLLKVKEDSNAQAILTSPNTWTLLEHLLSDISVESISGILVKIPTLPILNAFLGRALSIASQANLVEPAARVFRQIVPLAAQRATADAVQSSLEAAYKASLAADQPCQMWHQLLGGSFSDLAAALHLASAAVHKKLLSTFLENQLPQLMAILVRSDLPSDLVTAAQAPLQTICFSAHQLHKVLSHASKQDIDFMARWQKIQSPHKDDSAPVIFAAYVKSLKQYTPSFISSTASTSRSVTDAQTLLLVRGAAFAFLHDLLQHIQGSIASIQRLLAVVYEQHLYVPTLGHSDAWKQTLAQLLSLASVSTEKAHEQIRVDCMCLLMQIEPSLVEAKVDHLLPTLNLHHPHMRPLFDHLRNYFVRTRRLPDYVDLLIRTSAPASLPSFERTALARALSTSLQPSQSLSMCQKIVEQAMDFVLSGEAQQPPAKKLKKSRRSSTGTSTAPAQNLSLLEAATLVLEAVECPFVDQASLATTLSEALQRLMADEAHCGSESSLQMSAVYLGWMLRHAASMASRWSALNDTIDILAGQIQKTLESQNTSETTRYHALLVSFLLGALRPDHQLSSAIDFALDRSRAIDFSSIALDDKAREDGQSQEALSVKCWRVLVSFAPLIDASASPSQRETFAQVALDCLTAGQSAEGSPVGDFKELEFLSQPQSLSCQRLRGTILSQAGKLGKNVTNHTTSPNNNASKLRQSQSSTQVLADASKDAIAQSLELLLLQLQSSLAKSDFPTGVLQALADMLSRAPSGANRSISAAIAVSLRILQRVAVDIDVEQTESADIVAELCTFTSKVVTSQPSLLDHTDVAATLSLFIDLLQPSKSHQNNSDASNAIFVSIVSTVSTLVRHRKDLVVAIFPLMTQVMTLLLPLLRPLNIDSHQLPFWRVPPSTPADVKDARLYGRLLTNMTAKTVSQRTDASTRHVSSLHGPLSKHAGYFLLQYLRACTLSPAPLSLPTRTELSAGIYEVIGTMGKYERDSLMNSLLAPKDEAERMLLRSLWKDYERTRYKGQA